MLTPRKHLNLDTSLLRVLSLILRELQKRGVCEFDKLRHSSSVVSGQTVNFRFCRRSTFFSCSGARNITSRTIPSNTRRTDHATQPDVFKFFRRVLAY